MPSHDDKPWNELQWERFMQRSEARSARFGDLLETLMDHPDRDALIAKEMGWNQDDDGAEDEVSPDSDLESVEAVTVESFDEQVSDADFDESLDFDEIDAASLDSSRRVDRNRIPAYQLAFEIGLEVHRALEPYMKKLNVEGPLDDCGERLHSAYCNSLIPAAKIAGGNGMGYEDEALCGHIVCLRRGLEACVTAIGDIAWLQEHEHLPFDLATHFSQRLGQVRQAMEDRIAELRARVWWD